jgi:hypothetical protein
VQTDAPLINPPVLLFSYSLVQEVVLCIFCTKSDNLANSVYFTTRSNSAAAEMYAMVHRLSIFAYLLTNGRKHFPRCSGRKVVAFAFPEKYRGVFRTQKRLPSQLAAAVFCILLVHVLYETIVTRFVCAAFA